MAALCGKEHTHDAAFGELTVVKVYDSVTSLFEGFYFFVDTKDGSGQLEVRL